jgi:hypothetical protein
MVAKYKLSPLLKYFWLLQFIDSFHECPGQVLNKVEILNIINMKEYRQVIPGNNNGPVVVVPGKFGHFLYFLFR